MKCGQNVLRLLLGMAMGMIIALQFYSTSLVLHDVDDGRDGLAHHSHKKLDQPHQRKATLTLRKSNHHPKADPTRKDLGGAVSQEHPKVVPPAERRLLKDKLQEYHSTTGEAYPGNLWELSDHLPPWAKTYMQWHAQHRQNTTHFHQDNILQLRLFVVQCTGDGPCGGAGDRLKALPYLLRKAAETERFLVIHWTKPCALTEFLQPPLGGLDWRVPSWMLEALDTLDTPTRPHKSIEHIELYTNTTKLLEERQRRIKPKGLPTKKKNEPGVFFRTKLQIFDAGAGAYNEAAALASKQGGEEEATFEQIYHDLWSVLFTPSPPVATKIIQFLDTQQLTPGHYVSAHVRAVYDHEENPKLTKRWTINAVNCASHLGPGMPIFLAADSELSTQIGVEYGHNHSAAVMTHPSHPNPPLHLDRGNTMKDNSNTRMGVYPPPAEYYDTFVDLYLMSLARTVFTTRGGYGNWALLMGGNVTVAWRMQWKSRGGLTNKCEWLEHPGGQDSYATTEEEQTSFPIFRQAMPKTLP